MRITPQVRIGGATQPDIITQPVNYPLEKSRDEKKIAPDDYNKIVERVYSRVASEIYRQIKEDLANKVKLVPTHFMRAIAYYNEAKDFSRSNTIDAYDYAIELYREALRFFSISYRTYINKIAVKVPRVRWGIRYTHAWAKAEIEYADRVAGKGEGGGAAGKGEGDGEAGQKQADRGHQHDQAEQLRLDHCGAPPRAHRLPRGSGSPGTAAPAP